MTIVLSAGLLVLTAAVVLLFAMLGELTTRLPALGVTYRDPAVAEVPGAWVGASAESVPEPLAGVLDGEEPALVLVLSTACQSCDDVAVQLGELRRRDPVERLGVVVSCGDREVGDEFAARHGLRAWPCFVDEAGAWSRTTFGVQSSPTALVLREGRLASALVFTDVAAVRAAAAGVTEVDPRERVKA
jgi:hypothetical protein